MASRTPSRGRSRPSQPKSNHMPMVIGGVGLAVVVVLLVVMNSGGGTNPTPANTPNPAPKAAAPAPAPNPVQLAAAKAGKTPSKPAPALTGEMLQQARALIDAATDSCNQGIKARSAGDNHKARELQSVAKAKLDELKKVLAKPLLWQEEAQFEDWAQPAEYMTLEKLFGEYAKLEKKVRMNGGT